MISRMPKWVGDWLEKAAGPRLAVAEATYITPAIRKIRFQGTIPKMNLIGGASVIRVSETEYRNYTIAAHHPETGSLDIIFHIHGKGVGSRYIASLKAGDELYISHPRGRTPYDPKAKRYIIVGDETSLGLACSLLPVLKQQHHQFRFYFELHEENREAPPLLGLENYTVLPKDGSTENVKQINDLPVFKIPGWQESRFVLTGNVRLVHAFRRFLKGNAAGTIFSQGYWQEGKKGL